MPSHRSTTKKTDPERADHPVDRPAREPSPVPARAAAVLDLQRTAGNQVVSRLLAPPRPADSITVSQPGTVRRWFDEDTWMLPASEKTFEGWLEEYGENPDWIRQDDYDEAERLFQLVLDAQGNEKEARATHEALDGAWRATYLESGSHAWTLAVEKAAKTIEESGRPAAADAIAATWPGRNPGEVPEEFTKEVSDEVLRVQAAKGKALADAKEAERQKAAADAKALRDSQTRRSLTGKQVIRMCGYGGKTSVHPYWGGRILMINQRAGYHFTQFQDNYDSSAVYGAGTDIQTVINAVFGGTGGTNCLHVTQEVFGQADKRNPHYFLSGTHTPASETSAKVKEKSKGELKALIDDEKQRITNLLRYAP